MIDLSNVLLLSWYLLVTSTVYKINLKWNVLQAICLPIEGQLSLMGGGRDTSPLRSDDNCTSMQVSLASSSLDFKPTLQDLACLLSVLSGLKAEVDLRTMTSVSSSLLSVGNTPYPEDYSSSSKEDCNEHRTQEKHEVEFRFQSKGITAVWCDKQCDDSADSFLTEDQAGRYKAWVKIHDALVTSSISELHGTSNNCSIVLGTIDLNCDPGIRCSILKIQVWLLNNEDEHPGQKTTRKITEANDILAFSQAAPMNSGYSENDVRQAESSLFFELSSLVMTIGNVSSSSHLAAADLQNDHEGPEQSVKERAHEMMQVKSQIQVMIQEISLSLDAQNYNCLMEQVFQIGSALSSARFASYPPARTLTPQHSCLSLDVRELCVSLPLDSSLEKQAIHRPLTTAVKSLSILWEIKSTKASTLPHLTSIIFRCWVTIISILAHSSLTIADFLFFLVTSWQQWCTIDIHQRQVVNNGNTVICCPWNWWLW